MNDVSANICSAKARSNIDINEKVNWPTSEGVARVPYAVFSDEEIYDLEHEKIFKGPVWNYLCLDIEIPEMGDILTSWVGEIPVIVTKDFDGKIHAMVNRCAHKGALVCLKEKDNRKSLTCVYHAWNYGLDGTLKSVAFQKGLNGKGGMPEDFDVKKHRLEPLRVEVYCGMIFGTFSAETKPIKEFLGNKMCNFLERNLNRGLKILGKHSQMIHNNWKLYAENVRDSYHATLLHTFYTTFKVNRLDMDGGIILSDEKWHHISYSKRSTFKKADEYDTANVHSAKYDSTLQGPDLIKSWVEFDDEISHSIQTVFPNLVIQYTLNSLAIRHFIPRGVDETELFWIFLGTESDTPEQEEMRIMQGNLTGAAGLVALEDGCINSFVQRGTKSSPELKSFVEMGGTKAESNESSRATEAAVRGFWHGYRKIMGVGN